MIEVITGPMYSGKTEELIRRMTRAKIAGKRVVAFKPYLDDRYGIEVLASHSGIKIECIPVDPNLNSLIPIEDYDVIGFDEAQFFGDNIINVVNMVAGIGTKCYVAGLDMTYRREPFASMPTLMAIASDVLKLKAVCNVCGEDACYTQRLIDKRPAPFNGPTIEVGAMDKYEARCWYCFEPGI